MLDEATASVDNDTDVIVQKMIRESFKDATVLTIAHRLNTIIDSNRIIVMDKGVIAEIGDPTVLVEKEGGSFSALWKQHSSS